MIKFWTGFVWPEAEDFHGESLLLQQVRCGRQSMVLAVIGKETEEKSTVREMKDWFQREGILLCRGADEKRAEGRITEALKAFVSDGIDLIGILMAGDRFWLIQGKGQYGIFYLFNRRILKAHVRPLPVSGVICGGMEKGIGILMGSRGFFEGLSSEWLEQCLAVHEISREIQVDNRLKELEQEGYGRCGTRGCAIYVKTV